MFRLFVASAGMAFARIEEAPHWIESESIREQFNTYGIATRAMPRGDRGYHTDNIARSWLEYRGAFQGSFQARSYSFEEFRDSLLYFLPGNETCIEYLDYWFVRPGWYVPRRADIIITRECTEDLLEAIPADTTDPATIMHGTRLVDIMASVMLYLFSPEGDFIIDSEVPSSDTDRVDFTDFVGFQQYVAASPVLSGLLAPNITLESVRDSLAGVDRRFLDRIIAFNLTHPMMIQMTDFADSLRSMALWNFVLTNPAFPFDRIDTESVSSRAVLREKPRRALDPRIRSFPEMMAGAPRRGWGSTIAVVGRLGYENHIDVLTRCLPRDNSMFMSSLTSELGYNHVTVEEFKMSMFPNDHQVYQAFEYAEVENPNAHIDYFKCLLQAVESGELSLGDLIEDPDNRGARGLLWLARIVSSAIAYTLNKYVELGINV